MADESTKARNYDAFTPLVLAMLSSRDPGVDSTRPRLLNHHHPRPHHHPVPRRMTMRHTNVYPLALLKSGTCAMLLRIILPCVSSSLVYVADFLASFRASEPIPMRADKCYRSTTISGLTGTSRGISIFGLVSLHYLKLYRKCTCQLNG